MAGNRPFLYGMRKVTLQKFIDQFNGKEVQFTEFEIEHRDRMLFVLELIVKKFSLTDKQIYNKVKKKFNVTYPTVLKDIAVSQRLIANQINPKGDPGKIWVRYLVEQGAKEAMQMAKEKGDAKGYAYAVGMIGKYHMADKEDIVIPDYSDIKPFQPELTLDPSVIGIEKPKNLEEIRAKYKKKFDEEFKNYMRKLTVPDAEIIEEDEQ